MIKAIIFDYGGVVGTEVMPFIYSKLSNALDLGIDTIKTRIKKPLLEFQKGSLTPEEFWKMTAKELRSKSEKIKELWMNTYDKTSEANKEIKDLIKELKEKGYKVVLLSDTIEPFAKHHNKKGEYNLFHHVILSCEVGMKKPEREIYELALKEFGVNADECVFVDDKEINLETAKELGMKTILFKNAEQLRKDLIRCGVHGL